jgi:hypothetical protein
LAKAIKFQLNAALLKVEKFVVELNGLPIVAQIAKNHQDGLFGTHARALYLIHAPTDAQVNVFHQMVSFADTQQLEVSLIAVANLIVKNLQFPDKENVMPEPQSL